MSFGSNIYGRLKRSVGAKPSAPELTDSEKAAKAAASANAAVSMGRNPDGTEKTPEQIQASNNAAKAAASANAAVSMGRNPDGTEKAKPINVMNDLAPLEKKPNAGVQYLENVVTGNQPPINIESSFNAGDSALARQAQDMRAQTGGALAKADQLGQGQAIIEGQRTEQNVMANLTQRENEKALARINETKSQQARRDSAAQILSNYGISRDSLDIQARGQEAEIRFKQIGINDEKMANLMEQAKGNPNLLGKLLRQSVQELGISYSPEEVDQDIKYIQDANALDPETQILNHVAQLLTNPPKAPEEVKPGTKKKKEDWVEPKKSVNAMEDFSKTVGKKILNAGQTVFTPIQDNVYAPIKNNVFKPIKNFL